MGRTKEGRNGVRVENFPPVHYRMRRGFKNTLFLGKYTHYSKHTSYLHKEKQDNRRKYKWKEEETFYIFN